MKFNKAGKMKKEPRQQQQQQQQQPRYKKKQQQEKKIVKSKYQGRVERIVRKNNSTPFGFLKYNISIKDDNNNNNILENTNDAAANETKETRKEIFFSYHNIQTNRMELQRGDQVEFLILDKKNQYGRPKAINITVRRLAHRTAEELLAYVASVKILLLSSDRNAKELRTQVSSESPDVKKKEREGRPNRKVEFNPREVLASPVIWQCVARQVAFFENNHILCENFLQCLLLLVKYRRTMEEMCRRVILGVTSEYNFFNPIRGRFRNYIRGNNVSFGETSKGLVKEFLLAVAALVPEKRSSILGLIVPFVVNPEAESVAFFYELLKSLTSSTGDCIEDMDWRELPRILKSEEIFKQDDDSISLRQKYNLRQVLVQGAYESVEEYLDVYFRLLREDCFHSLRTSIKDLLRGTLGKF